MADAETNEAKISIKVFIDNVKKRVVYAEADHTFVDILFSLVTLPLGTIVKMLGKHADTKFEALGSLNNLYKSLQDFPESYFATEECKFMLLNPRSLSHDRGKNLKLKIDDTDPVQQFVCGSCWSMGYSTSCYFSICSKAKCKTCGGLMNKPHSIYSNICDGGGGGGVFVSDISTFMNKPHSTHSNICDGGGGGGVFVSDIATFIVTDDFTVKPYSAASIFGMLTDLGINDMSHLEEKSIDLSSTQMLHLLKMALSLDLPFTRLMFHNDNPIPAGLVVPGHGSISDQSDHFIKNDTSTCSKMVLDVCLQKSTGKLLFAEAKEDFVEFLFGFLSIPLGTVIGTLMNGASSVGCMDNVVKSISNMSVGRHIKSQDIKNMLLKPHYGQEYSSKNQLFPINGILTTPKVCNKYTYRLKDPRLNEQLLRPSGMFFVTDDLVISPSSSQLVRNTLAEFKVALNDIEKCEISIGLEEGLRMLRASLRSTSTLASILEQLKN